MDLANENDIKWLFVLLDTNAKLKLKSKMAAKLALCKVWLIMSELFPIYKSKQIMKRLLP